MKDPQQLTFFNQCRLSFINNGYKATNILIETKKKPKIEEIIDLIISSYENFFVNLNLYNYESFKKKAESMALN